MAGSAHHCAGSCACGHGRLARESGFSLTELIVVLVLVGIALSVGLSTMLSLRHDAADSKYVIAASTAWRGIGSYRLDNKGAFPPAQMLGGGGNSFTNLAGARYVRSWPEDPSTGGPLRIRAASGRPPRSGPPNSVSYAVSGDAAWLAAFGHDGQVVFLRGVQPGATVVPAG